MERNTESLYIYPFDTEKLLEYCWSLSHSPFCPQQKLLKSLHEIVPVLVVLDMTNRNVE
jgi:hypothetical protein